jgi:hypothetical protein
MLATYQQRKHTAEYISYRRFHNRIGVM